MRLFFFSSRRRHTRFDCDWSSDVCSSDLPNSERSWTLSPDTPRGGDRISTSGFGIPSLSPTRDEFRALAAQGNLVPVFAELPADLDTPLSAYLRLRPGPYAFLLESVEGGEVWARYSFLSADPLMVLTAKNGRLTLKRGARIERLPDGNPLGAVRDLLGQFQPVAVPGLPRFQGGAVGYLAYDMVHHMERLPRTTEADLGLPDADFLFTDTLLVFRSEEHTSELQSQSNLVCRLLLEKKKNTYY